MGPARSREYVGVRVRREDDFFDMSSPDRPRALVRHQRRRYARLGRRPFYGFSYEARSRAARPPGVHAD